MGRLSYQGTASAPYQGTASAVPQERSRMGALAPQRTNVCCSLVRGLYDRDFDFTAVFAAGPANAPAALRGLVDFRPRAFPASFASAGGGPLRATFRFISAARSS